jgi:hypothetical protein
MVTRRHLIQGEGEIENNDETLRKSRVKVRFTQEEDNYLRKGIVKFGMCWTAILNCPLYKFEQSRAPTTLYECVRQHLN